MTAAFSLGALVHHVQLHVVPATVDAVLRGGVPVQLPEEVGRATDGDAPGVALQLEHDVVAAVDDGCVSGGVGVVQVAEAARTRDTRGPARSMGDCMLPLPQADHSSLMSPQCAGPFSASSE